VNRAAKGARVERKAAARLRSQGWRVTRSAASLGAFDLVAFRRDAILLVQVRANAWPGRALVRRMRRFPAPASVRRELWRWDDYARAPSIRVL
jgi:hypothetical protein